MTDKEKKADKKDPTNINITIQTKKESPKNQENKGSQIGKKRERPKDEQEDEKVNIKNCNYCKKSITADFLDLNKNKNNPNESIIEIISTQLKNEKFLKILKENSEKMKNIIVDNNEIINTNKIMCHNCVLNNFIIGGFEKIFMKQDNDINNRNILKDGDDQNNNLKQILDINLNLAINSLKKLKEKYSKIIETTNDIFENKSKRSSLSNNSEDYLKLKKEMDNCKQNLKEIGENFENLIKNLSSQEELKKYFIKGVFSNDNTYKNNLLKLLKQLENEIEINTNNNSVNMNGGIKLINNDDNNKNIGLSDELYYNLIKNEKEKEINDNNKIYNKNNIQNNQLLYNIQNQKKQNSNEQLLLNNISQNNLIQNNPIDPFNSPTLGLITNVGLSQGGRIPNNILSNNLPSSPILSPQILGQINNNNQINSIIPNNNNNINSPDNRNSNMNNLNNLTNMSFSTINGILSRPYFGLSSPNDSDTIYLRPLFNNNNQSNIINNPYNNLIYPNPLPPIISNFFGPSTSPLPSPGLAGNFGPSSSQFYNSLLNIQSNNNNIPNISQSINNNSNKNNNNIEQNKANQINNLINNDRNLMNVNNTNNKNLNMNDLNNINMNNINNMNNLKSMNNMNNMNNINNINNINNLNGLNNLTNNINRNEINNNLYLYQGQHQQQPMIQNVKDNQNLLVGLFNEVAKEKVQNASSNNDNNSNIKNNNNNNNINNINTQAEMAMNNNEQNNLQQINKNLQNAEKKNSLMSSNNINKTSGENKGIHNGKEQSKKDD